MDGMEPEPSRDSGIARSAELVPTVAAAVVGVGTAALLAIWPFNPAMKEFSGPTMKANPTVGMLLAASSLAMLKRPSSPKRERWGRWLAVGVILVGGATGIEYLSGLDFGIDEFLVDDFLNEESRRFPGRMSPIAATCFCLLGFALLVLNGGTIEVESGVGGGACFTVRLPAED